MKFFCFFLVAVYATSFFQKEIASSSESLTDAKQILNPFLRSIKFSPSAIDLLSFQIISAFIIKTHDRFNEDAFIQLLDELNLSSSMGKIFILMFKKLSIQHAFLSTMTLFFKRKSLINQQPQGNAPGLTSKFQQYGFSVFLSESLLSVNLPDVNNDENRLDELLQFVGCTTKLTEIEFVFVHFDRNSIHSLNLIFVRNPSIQRISFRMTSFHGNYIYLNFKSLISLRHLAVTDQNISEAHFNLMLEALPFLSKLEHLTFSDTFCNFTCNHISDYIIKLNGLKHFNIMGNYLDNIGIAKIADLLEITSGLQSIFLDIPNGAFSTVKLTHKFYQSIEKCSELKDLILKGLTIVESDLKLFGEIIRALPSLEVLGLSILEGRSKYLNKFATLISSFSSIDLFFILVTTIIQHMPNILLIKLFRVNTLNSSLMLGKLFRLSKLKYFEISHLNNSTQMSYETAESLVEHIAHAVNLDYFHFSMAEGDNVKPLMLQLMSKVSKLPKLTSLRIDNINLNSKYDAFIQAEYDLDTFKELKELRVDYASCDYKTVKRLSEIVSRMPAIMKITILGSKLSRDERDSLKAIKFKNPMAVVNLITAC